MKVLFVMNSTDKYFYAGIASLSAMLKKHGHQTKLLNYDSRFTPELFIEEVKAYDPGLVGFTILSYQWPMIQDLLRLVKEKTDYPTVCGGYHVSFAEETVILNPHVDYICKGEGDHALVDLVTAMEAGTDDTKIPNIWKKVQGPDGKPIIHRNEMRPLPLSMDDLPDWDRDIFPLDTLLQTEVLLSYIHAKRTMPVSAGRGCPYTCSYCANSALLKMYKGKGKFVRRRTVPRLMEELEYLHDRYEIDQFEFWDEDFFAISSSWLKEFFTEYEKRIPVQYMIGARADNASDENIKMAADSGCYLLCMGIEHGNEDFRAKVLDRRMKNSRVERAFETARNVGLQRAALNIIGFPGETPEMVMETLELNKRIDPDYFHHFIYQPFLGCDLYEVSKELGYLPNLRYAVYQQPEGALVQPTLTIDQIRECWGEFTAFRKVVDERRSKRFVKEGERDTMRAVSL